MDLYVGGAEHAVCIYCTLAFGISFYMMKESLVSTDEPFSAVD